MRLLGISWWFIRQGIVLDGDFLGLHTRNVLTAQYGRESVKYASTFAGQGISFFGMIKEMIARRLPSKLAGTLIDAYCGRGVKPQVWYYALYGLVWLAPAMYYIAKGLERLGKKVPLCAGIILVLCAFWQVFAVALPVYL